jgi:hypothetical protein
LKAPELFFLTPPSAVSAIDGFEAYATFLRNLTPEFSNSNSGNNRTQTNGNQNATTITDHPSPSRTTNLFPNSPRQKIGTAESTAQHLLTKKKND